MVSHGHNSKPIMLPITFSELKSMPRDLIDFLLWNAHEFSHRKHEVLLKEIEMTGINYKRPWSKAYSLSLEHFDTFTIQWIIWVAQDGQAPLILKNTVSFTKISCVTWCFIQEISCLFTIFTDWYIYIYAAFSLLNISEWKQKLQFLEFLYIAIFKQNQDLVWLVGNE